jgi:hypothetical protein
MSFSPTTGLYFYSAIFQGNMALLGLVGVFAVFIAQQLESQIVEVENNIRAFVDRFVDQKGLGRNYPTNWHSVSDYDMVLQNVLESPDYNEDAKRCAEELINDISHASIWAIRGLLILEHDRIIDSIKKPMIWTVIVIMLSLLLLPFADTIHQGVSTRNECLLFLLTVVVNTYALWLNVRFIIVSLKRPKDKIAEITKGDGRNLLR